MPVRVAFIAEIVAVANVDEIDESMIEEDVTIGVEVVVIRGEDVNDGVVVAIRKRSSGRIHTESNLGSSFPQRPKCLKTCVGSLVKLASNLVLVALEWRNGIYDSKRSLREELL